MSSESVGKEAKDELIEECLKKKQKFFEPIRRQRLKTFADMGNTVVKTTSNRELFYRQQSNIAFQLLVRDQEQPEKIELKELVKYPLMPVPYAIGTADGFLLKMNKAKGFEFLAHSSDLGIRILFETGSGNKRRLLEITKLAKDFTRVYCAALLAM